MQPMFRDEPETHKDKEKPTMEYMGRQHERHTTAGWGKLEDALPLRSKLTSVAMVIEPIR